MSITTTKHTCPECGHVCNVSTDCRAAACPVCTRMFSVAHSLPAVPSNLHHRLMHCITEYDRKEQAKRSYNPHALPLYMQGVDHVEELLGKGTDLRRAITDVFTGRLLDRVLKACDLPKSTDAEQRY